MNDEPDSFADRVSAMKVDLFEVNRAILSSCPRLIRPLLHRYLRARGRLP